MPKEKIYAAVDDSGDPGVKGSCSQNFILAAVVCSSPEQVKALSDHINTIRQNLGWSPETEFKFRKTRKSIIKDLLRSSLNYEYQIYAILTDKNFIRNNTSMLTRESLYRLATNNLLSTIPFDSNSIKIQLDGLLTKQYRRTTISRLRQTLRQNNPTSKIQIKFVDSVEENLIQLADLVAGALNRSMLPNKTDAHEYRNIINPRIVKFTVLGNNDLSKNKVAGSIPKAGIHPDTFRTDYIYY